MGELVTQLFQQGGLEAEKIVQKYLDKREIVRGPEGKREIQPILAYLVLEPQGAEQIGALPRFAQAAVKMSKMKDEKNLDEILNAYKELQESANLLTERSVLGARVMALLWSHDINPRTKAYGMFESRPPIETDLKTLMPSESFDLKNARWAKFFAAVQTNVKAKKEPYIPLQAYKEDISGYAWGLLPGGTKADVVVKDIKHPIAGGPVVLEWD